MKQEISDQDLLFKYPSEAELGAWFDSLEETVQKDFDYEYQNLIPDWYNFLRRKRFERFENRNNNR